MLATAATGDRYWLIGGAVALAGHVAMVAGVLATGSPSPDPIEEDPVVLVELPPMAAPAPMAQAQVAEPQPDYVPPQAVQPRIEAPQVRAPLPRELVAAPPPPPLPARSRPVPAAAAAPPPPSAVAFAPAGVGTGTSSTPGDDPKAKRQEADYFALVSAHLNRKKRYPAEAKKARQQGVVTVRFTVHRDGSISGASIKRGSGHDLLDRATLELMQRVAPLPRFPKSMAKDSVTLSLPIDYSLRTS